MLLFVLLIIIVAASFSTMLRLRRMHRTIVNIEKLDAHVNELTNLINTIPQAIVEVPLIKETYDWEFDDSCFHGVIIKLPVKTASMIPLKNYNYVKEYKLKFRDNEQTAKYNEPTLAYSC
jgi:hypothetical protein